MDRKKIAIIGAGLGGLAAALRLRILGYDVDVYEQNSFVGGKAGQIEENGFRFDTGPSLLTMPFVLEELFSTAGENIENHITLKQPEVTCKYFYPDSTIISAYADITKFATEIENKTLDNAISVKRYLNYCEKIYKLSSALFLFKSFTEKKNFFSLSALKTFFNIKSLDTNRTMHEANSKFFKDAKIIQLFDRYATYNGSNPYKAPATLNIIQHVEYNLGGFISLDGIHSIPKAIKNVTDKKGVQFFLNTKVEKIIHSNSVVKGIKINGKTIDYDIVVSNSDVENTYRYLLGDTKSKTAKRYSTIEKSTSAIVFYWGVEGLHQNLEVHNILFSCNYKIEFDELFEKNKTPNDPTIYIYISSKFKEDDAPKGHENWFVMINAPYNKNQNWYEEVKKVREIIINKISTRLDIDINSKIKFEKVLTPVDIEKQTSSIGGSIYGISSNNRMAAFLRQQNRSKNYKGLYFCGGSAHPGGGIPLVLLSGKITADLINKYEKRDD